VSSVRATLGSGLVITALLVAGCGSDHDPAGVSAESAPASSAGVATPSGPASAGPEVTTPAKAGRSLADTSRTGWDLPTGKITVRDVSLVARSTVPRIEVYRTATSASPQQTIAGPLATGGPLVFLVQGREADRIRVLLPIRPNESLGWVRAADVKLSELDYRITVSAGAHRLRLYKAGKLVMNEPVGLGKGTTPTPGGVYYLKELLRPSNPKGSYGPYAYGLSGYSTVLDEFLGGDGQIGIHGTNDPASVGRNVSHGCIRMRNAAITRMARMLPLGVPVQMIA
jgi:lipoprotein-anchoring transpeptidase ErfK/SrfK